jgi:TonB-linked SusC/RagA family outer membrane protein
MKEKVSILLFGLLMFAGGLFAQSKITVSGLVLESGTSEPIIGASVVVKGTSIGAICDIDGKYILSDVPSDGILSFSFVGMKKVEVPINGKKIINVTMISDTQQLNDVVVIGYGTSKAKDLTSPISVVKSDQIVGHASSSPMGALQGQVAGLNVTNTGSPGSSPKVNIRGVGSFSNSTPLYVVDGMFYDNISFLDNNDIQEITVLKDASAASIYGVRAANGVIIVTTKKGRRNQKTQISYNGYFGIQQTTNVLPMANSHEYATMMLEADPTNYTSVIKASIARYGGNYDTLTFGANTDWYKELIRTAVITNHSLDITGGSDKATYSVGLNYMYQDGIMDVKNNYKRMNMRANVDFDATSWLKVGANLVMVNSDQWVPDNAAWQKAYNTPGLIPVIDNTQTSEIYPVKYASPSLIGFGANFYNPVVVANYGSNNKNETFQVLPSFYAEISLIPDHLKFKTNYSIDFSLTQNRDYTQSYYVGSNQNNSVSSLSKSDTNYFNYVIDNTLTYNNKFGNHNITAMIGQSARQESYRYLKGTSSNVPGDYEEYLYLSQGNSDGRTVSDDGTTYRGLSYFARLSYNYADKYLLSATMRADGSSKYQTKWGYFPSLGVAWVMSNEPFMKNQHFLNYLKLRASWGKLGNDHVAASDGFASIKSGSNSYSGVFGSTTVAGYQNVSYFSWLRWEVVNETNLGLNFATLNNKLNVDLDYYYRLTSNAVINTLLPLGAGTLAGNNGKIANSGIEMQLNWNDKIGKDFTYRIGANISTLRNRVKSLNGAPYIYETSSDVRDIVGHEMNSYYGWKVAGVYQNAAEIAADPVAVANSLEPGDFKYKDLNGDHVIDDKDRQVLGSNNPTYAYGLNIGLQYKNLEFNLMAQGQGGNEIYDEKRALRYAQTDYNFDKDFYKNRWTSEGSSNTYCSAKAMTKGWNNSHCTSFFVEKGDYFRIQNIELAYNFKNLKVGSYTLPLLRLSLNAERPLTVFNTNGFTPEITDSKGWDTEVYPLTAIYTFGLRLNF